jgi:hypothetical protein
MRASEPISCRRRTSCQSGFRQGWGNRPQSTPLLFNVVINLRRGAVFDDLLAVKFQFSSATSRPFHASNRLCSFCHCVFRSLRQALFRCSHYTNKLFAPFAVLLDFDSSVGIVPLRCLVGTLPPHHAKGDFLTAGIVSRTNLQRDFL